jgi:hypothetical protein
MQSPCIFLRWSLVCLLLVKERESNGNCVSISVGLISIGKGNVNAWSKLYRNGMDIKHNIDSQRQYT